MMKTIRLFFVFALLLLGCSIAQAQLGRRIGNAMERAAENAVTRQAERRTSDAVNKAIDDAFDNSNNNEKNNNNSNTNANQPATNAPANTDNSGNAGNANNAGAQQSPNTPPKLESFTQYDFVPGDQILFFEDFSQDAIGDFPDLWTTDKSAEIRTINIAPGKWLHPTTKDGTFTYMNTIAFPQNFIVEFDYIPTHESPGFGFTLYNDPDNKELDTGLFPGDQGLRIYFNNSWWDLSAYKRDADQNRGSSEKNAIVRYSVNHIIIWVQNRRVRMYHLGEKVVDLPTVLHPNTTFNRFRFFGWGNEDLPFISNIKITTAAPDVRSKLLTEGKIISYGINFDSGKDVIKPESYGAIKSIADVLNENPDVRVRVLGHTDSDGNADANLDLSKRRAAAVKDFLTKNFGIAATRIETDGKGQTEPLAPNNTTEGKAKNRRVEFVKL